MPASSPKSRAYKEITIQQLRSFCETARLGSLTAAAAALELTHPTVWAQVHALEREFGMQLFEFHGRGARLTDDGQLLAQLAVPIVQDVASLKQRVQEARDKAGLRLSVAGTPRLLQEDLPRCIREFERRHPDVRVTILEMRLDNVIETVESGTSDVGFITDQVPSRASPWLSFLSCYELETLLLTTADHPLARKRRVQPKDLRHYPIISSRDTVTGLPHLGGRLEKFGVFEGPPARVEASFTGTIRTYVAMGFGIALIQGLASHVEESGLHARPMSRYFGKGAVNAVIREAGPRSATAIAFVETVRALNQPPSARRARKTSLERTPIGE